MATAPTVTYIYDNDSSYGTSAPGALVRFNVGSNYQERYTFDSLSRVNSTIRTMDSRTYTTGYNSYNEASQLTQMTYPSTRQISFSYDSIGRLSALVNYLSNISYNIGGQVTGDRLGTGVTEVFGYDSQRMQMTSQKAGTTSPYTNRMNPTYSYNASAGQMGVGSTAGNAGQLMSISGTVNSSTESASYTYDNYGRLATSDQTSNSSSAQRRFAYDRWGNRTGTWDAVSGGTQIQSIALQQSGGAPTNRIASETVSGAGGYTRNYSYDSNGNVTDNGLHTFTYDSENRLVGTDIGTATYDYDYQNRRYKKSVGNNITHYIWEGGQVVAEHNGSTGVVQVDYIYNGSRLIAKAVGGTVSYLLGDRLNARMTLDASGTILGRQAHLPFGEDFAGSGTQQKQHFTNYERDNESSLDYATNRSYGFGTGRFLQADPYDASGKTMSPQSWNRYSYTQNDPVNLSDPAGLQIAAPGYDPNACWIIIVGTTPIATLGNCDSSGEIGATPGIGGGTPGGSNPETGPSLPPINIPQPGPGKKKCNINAKVNRGESIPVDVPLTYPDGSITIGPTDLTIFKDNIVKGWFYKVLIEASVSVSEDINNWEIAQYATVSTSHWRAYVDDNLQNIDDDTLSNEFDTPKARYIYIHPPDKWVFWLDTPGPMLDVYTDTGHHIRTVNIDAKYDITSILRRKKGKESCSIIGTWR